ncbi:pre-mRNA-splicing regulator WTAP-like isoform X2 [Rhopilema esculentum]
MKASELKDLSKDEITSRYTELEKYISSLDEKSGQVNPELEEKLKLQQQESTRRENVLVMRLATKEQEMQELLTQIHELKQSQTPATSQLKSTLLDPSVNLLFEKMKTELGETKDKLEQAQNDLSAWKFTPDSVTGKKLMAKCRMLIAENQDLGKQLSQGRIAQLEAELALQKKYNEELKCSQDELNDFVLQLDEEVEGMESTICALQQQLKETKEKYQLTTAENNKQRTTSQGNGTKTGVDLKRTFDQSSGTVEDMDAKRARNVFDVIDNPAFGEESDDLNERTKLSAGEDPKLMGKSPIKTSIKNPFSISNLLSPEVNISGDKGHWQVTDDIGTAGMKRTPGGLKKEGTNGETYESDS